MEISKLPVIQKRIGPLFSDPDDSKRFLEKYKKSKPFIEDDHWVVEVRRKFLAARDKLKDSLSEPLDVLKAKGIPNHIAEKVVKEFEIFSENVRAIELIEKDKKFGIFLRKYFEKESLV